MRRDQAEAEDSAKPRRFVKGLEPHAGADLSGRQMQEVLVAVNKLPASSFSRMWILGSAQAKVAFAYAACWLRSRFADAGEKERLRNEANLTAALQLVGAMGYLKGAVMKVGQLLASLPEVLPEEFAKALAALHFEAPPMHYALVREVFLDEFGREPEEVFASFAQRPFAAASLGQVHRALLHSGEEVAVKIQYPGIAGAIKADMRNLRMLMQPMCMTGDWQNLLDKLADVEEMLLMETDYRQEAHFGREIRRVFADVDAVVVPQIYERYSSGRVLTTQFLPGVHLEEFLSLDPTQELRNRFTHLITAATMRLMYRAHWILADPNPGNYVFMADGRLGLIDFGCTRRITDEEWSVQMAIEKATLEGDEPEVDRLIAKACLYDGPESMGAERLKLVGKGIRWQLEPWTKQGMFDFGDREFFRAGIDAYLEIARKRYTRGTPLYLWTTRFILGARGMVFRLNGSCDFKEIHRQESAVER